MRIFSSLVALILLLSSCTHLVDVEYEETTPVLMEKSAKTLNLSEQIKTILPQGASVCLKSIESRTTTDDQFTSLIEDNLVQDLVKAGIRIVERDADAISGIQVETQNENYNNAIFFPVMNAVDDEAKIPQSEYTIFYRILDIGTYNTMPRRLDKVNGKFVGVGSKRRVAIVKLHYRLVDNKSSRIVYANDIMGKAEDFVKSAKIMFIDKFKLQPSFSVYPRQNNDEKDEYIVKCCLDDDCKTANTCYKVIQSEKESEPKLIPQEEKKVNKKGLLNKIINYKK